MGQRRRACTFLAALLGLGVGGGALGQALPYVPYELRQISSRYPVTLYTGTPCAPCDAGRHLLLTRGIPFQERTVNTPAAGVALQALNGGSTQLPVLTIGQQRLQGFQPRTWHDYLDAAGYPATSQLPPAYRQPAATPLAPAIPPQAAPSQTSSSAGATPAASTPAAAPNATEQPANRPARTADNPAGIQF